MNLSRQAMIGLFLLLLAIQLFSAVELCADVIYLSDGNILLVDKAWEEGEEVKYQTSKGVQSLPKSSVREIQKEEPVAVSGGQKWVRVNPEGRSEPAGNSTPAPVPSIVTPPGGSSVSKEALVRLRNNLNTDPSDAISKAELVRALNSVASLQVSEGDLVSARKSLEEALKLDMRNPALLANLATVSFRMGNYQNAEDLLLRYLEVKGKDQWGYYFLGEAYYEQEKISQAISTWSEGLRLGPNQAISERLEKARRESGVHEELRALESAHFFLRYDRKGSSYALGEQILTALEELYRRLTSELTPQAPAKVAVILYPDQAYFDITRAPGWSGGVFDGKIRVPIKGLFSVTPELKAVLVHELTHCFMAALPGRGSPTWFLEGVAQLQEGRSAAEYGRVLRQFQQASRLTSLADLSGSFVALPAGAVDVAYAQSLAAVEYLVARFGRAALRNLLEQLAQNNRFENAFKAALQKTIPEFEAEWRQSLTQ